MSRISVNDPYTEGQRTNPITILALSHLCFICGFLSIGASIFIWFLFRTPDLPHGERLGIFVGLWAPTFFALSDRLERYANRQTS